jgi:hypothetical protein
MKTRFVAAMLLGAVLLPPAARPAAAAGLTQEKLNGIFKKLEANGELWLKDEQIPADAKVDLNSVRFDKDSAAYLEPILRSSRREPSRLWAINKLLNRLQQADAETIQAVLPAVKALHGRIKGTYRSFPKLTDRQADSLKLPPYDERITTAFIMGRMALLDKQRDAKVAREVPLAKHNEAVYDLEKNTYRLMCLAGDPREDTACAKALFVEEGRGNAIFITIADAISEHARKMTPERARKLYPLFRPHLSRLAMQPRGSTSTRARPTSAGRRPAPTTAGRTTQASRCSAPTTASSRPPSSRTSRRSASPRPRRSSSSRRSGGRARAGASDRSRPGDESNEPEVNLQACVGAPAGEPPRPAHGG